MCRARRFECLVRPCEQLTLNTPHTLFQLYRSYEITLEEIQGRPEHDSPKLKLTVEGRNDDAYS